MVSTLLWDWRGESQQLYGRENFSTIELFGSQLGICFHFKKMTLIRILNK
jgi:hypothetical protein